MVDRGITVVPRYKRSTAKQETILALSLIASNRDLSFVELNNVSEAVLHQFTNPPL